MDNNVPVESLFKGVGIEIDIKDPQNFLKIKETLTRIGVASKTTNMLYQSCHILHKRDIDGKSHYAIVHFKEMFKLDGKPSSLEDKDIERRNAIVRLLEEWSLLKVLKEDAIGVCAPMSSIKVISYADKKNWTLVEKYKIGRK